MGNPLVATEIDACLSTLLLQRLEASDMSQRELSRQSGVKLTRLGDVLRRGRGMTTGELEQIASALGLVPWQVLKEAEDLMAAERSSRAGLSMADDEATPEASGVSVGGATVRPLHGDDAYVEYVPSDLQAANDDGVDPELEAEGAVELP